MELLMLIIALFLFFFGSVIALRAAELGLRLADKLLMNSLVIIKKVLIFMVGLLVMLIKWLANGLARFKYHHTAEPCTRMTHQRIHRSVRRPKPLNAPPLKWIEQTTEDIE